MNTTLPGYQIVFVDVLPKKPKPRDSFSWVLKLSPEAFPSKDSLKSQEFIPLSHSAQDTQTKPLSEFCAPCKEPLIPFHSCLLEEDALLLPRGDESPLPEVKLPEVKVAEEDVAKRVEVQAEVGEMPLVQFHLKPHARAARAVPDFVSGAEEYSGSLLGRIRCFHGITLGELANATRVAQHHLHNIECEHYGSLPATVYLRGYLKSIARELGLDMQQVSQSYLDRMQQARS